MALPQLQLGKRIAPPRFIVFFVIFVLGVVFLPGPFGFGRGTMLAFDLAAAVFLVSIVPLLRQDDRDAMRVRAKTNDANRTTLLGLTFLTMLVILVSVAHELGGHIDSAGVVLVVSTLVLAWLFTNTVYAMHYAHIFYGDANSSGGDDGGLDFPKTPEPDYWDFVYYSFTLGMTFQTSDVDTTSGTMRRVSIGQCLAAFVFNLGVLAFTINVLGGGK
ncbi:DUF1345 domain-containing protein [uncultured Sphingomonas sp.]|uniref:DUF1345 domain-containing protein n=1 Tax=uncultured Sphingomonas sp. TaxID=158754 RepID=UPI0035CAFEBF